MKKTTSTKVKPYQNHDKPSMSSNSTNKLTSLTAKGRLREAYKMTSCQSQAKFEKKTNVHNSDINVGVKNIFISQTDLKRVKSAMQFNEPLMQRINSLQPFPRVDPEFYSGSPDYFWNKELQRVKTESLIDFKSTDQVFIQRNYTNFGKSNVFNKKDSNAESREEDACITKSRSVSRLRDYHTYNKVIPQSNKAQEVYTEYNIKSTAVNDLSPSKSAASKKSRRDTRDLTFNGVKTVTIDFLPSKTKTPMHLKLYESTLQESPFIAKTKVPSSHSSYEKRDDVYKPVLTPSFKKKIDLYKTTFNFLKNYY